ncbi:MAG TPA: c-type cytochrome, partial [Caldilineaceae bacterium]|nr:c-type cytochrome [Caldilineaceae bacterium]
MSKKRSTTKKRSTVATAPPPNRVRHGRGCSIAALALLIALLAGAALGTPWLLSVLANGATDTSALTPGAAHDLLIEQQQPALAQLESYGWVDQEGGIAHIPIDRAITLLAASELPVGELAAVPQETATGGTDGVPADVNFTDDILPIFLDRCSECHGDDEPEEGLVLTSYKDVMLGSWYGAVIKPGDPADSYLVEMVETGQMPKKGDDLTPEQIKTIIAWVEAGAPEFGSGEETGAEAAAVTPETVSFANDVLPIFLDRCSECHGEDEPEEGLVLLTY